MVHRRAACGLAAVVAVCVAPSSALAGIVDAFDVGSGGKSAVIQVDFSNGNGYLFTVHWSAASYTSWNAMLDIDAALPGVSLHYDTYPFGVLLTGVTIGGDADDGQGDLWPIENYWHFWVKDSGSWQQSMIGASDHQLRDGGADAWVFGSPTAPQVVPAPGAAALALSSLRRRRRRAAA
jgi:hypothetical protein